LRQELAEIIDLNIELLGCCFGSLLITRLSIDPPVIASLEMIDPTLDNQVGLAGFALELNLDDCFASAVFDEFNSILCSSEVFGEPAKTKTDGANKRTLSCAIWSDDHVQGGPGVEGGIAVCHKVLEFDSDNSTRLVFLLVRPHSCAARISSRPRILLLWP